MTPKTPSTAPKGLKFRRMLLEMLEDGRARRCSWSGYEHAYWSLPAKVSKYLKDRLLDPPRYQGTLTDRELGSWRVSAKLQLALADQTIEWVDWGRAFWGLAGALQASKSMTDSAIRNHTSAVRNGEHLKMKAGDLLRLLDAVEGR